MVRRVFSISAAALALAFAACSAGVDAPTNADARRALEAHQFSIAQEQVAHIFASGAADDETRLLKLEIMLQVGDGYAAMGAIDALPQSVLANDERRVARAHALILQGKPQLALDLYETLEAEDLSEQDFRMALWAIRELGEEEAFEAGMDDALDAYPDSADLNALAALQLIDLGLPQEAASFVTRALASQPDHYGALLARGQLAIIKEDMDGALEAYRSAAEAYPTRATPVANIGGLLLDMERIEEADAVLRKGVKAHPGNPFLQWQFARLALAQDDLETARLALENARRTYRGIDEFVLFSAQAEERFGNREIALAEYRRYLRAVGEDEGVERKISELEATS